MKICLTGPTGYVGGRLAPKLLDAGHSLCCLVRDRRKLDSRHWRSRTGVEVVEADLEDGDRLAGLRSRPVTICGSIRAGSILSAPG